MRKFYGILNSDGKLYMTWMLQPWMSSDLGSTKKTALTIGGKAVRVETVIYKPKRSKKIAAKTKAAPKKAAPKPVGRGKPKGARVSPRKVKKKSTIFGGFL